MAWCAHALREGILDSVVIKAAGDPLGRAKIHQEISLDYFKTK